MSSYSKCLYQIIETGELMCGALNHPYSFRLIKPGIILVFNCIYIKYQHTWIDTLPTTKYGTTAYNTTPILISIYSLSYAKNNTPR